MVRAIAESTERIGVEPFLAVDNISIGAKITDKITSAIDDSNCFVPIITQNSINSPWVNQEIAYAYAHSKLDEIGIFPVVETGTTPIGLIDASREYIKLDRADVDECIYILMTELRAYINRNVEALNNLSIECKCGNHYDEDLPSQERIDKAVREDDVFESKCDECGLRIDLNPRTFEIVRFSKVATDG